MAPKSSTKKQEGASPAKGSSKRVGSPQRAGAPTKAASAKASPAERGGLPQRAGSPTKAATAKASPAERGGSPQRTGSPPKAVAARASPAAVEASPAAAKASPAAAKAKASPPKKQKTEEEEAPAGLPQPTTTDIMLADHRETMALLTHFQAVRQDLIPLGAALLPCGRQAACLVRASGFLHQMWQGAAASAYAMAVLPAPKWLASGPDATARPGAHTSPAPTLALQEAAKPDASKRKLEELVDAITVVIRLHSQASLAAKGSWAADTSPRRCPRLPEFKCQVEQWELAACRRRSMCCTR